MNDVNTNITGNADELVRAIEEEARARAAAITRKADEEIRQLREHVEMELDEFRSAIAEETDQKISRETRILENRMALESEKMRMRILDEYTGTILERVISELRDRYSDLYHQFLESTLDQGVRACMDYGFGEIQVYVHPDDIEEVESIFKSLSSHMPEGFTSWVQRGTDIDAGVLFEPADEKIYLNFTMDRVLFRKRNSIRQLLHGFLEENIEVQTIKAAGHD